MNHLTDLKNLKTFLRLNNLRPKDYLGQNFLVDEEALQGIIAAADLKQSDVVLEIGPGLGVLTSEFVKKAGRVVAVEKDRKLVDLLNRNAELVSASRTRDPESSSGLRSRKLKIINSDILRFNLAEQISGPYKVVANIPYYLTSKLLQNFLESENKPTLMVLMVQKEVGERVTAGPGDLSILGISVQIYADAELCPISTPDLIRGRDLGVNTETSSEARSGYIIPKESFWPAPEVDSVILKITPRDKYPEIADKKLFFRLVKMAFAGKRKQIHNTLVSGLKLPKDEVFKLLQKAGIEPTLRPQDLQIEQWIKFYKVIGDR